MNDPSSEKLDTEPQERTTVSISQELAEKLYNLKGRERTYETLIWELLEHYPDFQGRDK